LVFCLGRLLLAAAGSIFTTRPIGPVPGPSRSGDDATRPDWHPSSSRLSPSFLKFGFGVCADVDCRLLAIVLARRDVFSVDIRSTGDDADQALIEEVRIPLLSRPPRLNPPLWRQTI